MKEVSPTLPASTTAEESTTSERYRYIKRRIVRGLGAVTLGTGGALAAFNTYGAQSDIGPLHVSTHVVLDNSTGITSDLADLKINDTPFSHLPIGAYADVTRTDTDATSPTTLAKSAGIVGDPKAITEQLIGDYTYQASIAGGIGATSGIAAEGLLTWAARPDRRRKLYAASSVSSVLGSAALFSLPTYSYNAVPWQTSDLTIDDHSYSIGYAGGGAGQLVNEIDSNERYYNAIEKNLKAALAPIQASDERDHKDETKLLFYSDWHCNYGMARALKQTTESLKIATTINGGDNVMGGTPTENACIDVLAKNLSKTLNYTVAGNHDSNITMKRMVHDGFIYLDNKPAIINGMKAYGTTDPYVTPFNSTLIPRVNQADVDNFAAKTAEATCKDEPELLINHEPASDKLSQQALDCAHLTLSGHTHTQTAAESVGPDNFHLTTGTAGGAAPHRLSVAGELGKDASLDILYAKDNQVVATRIITIHPNKSVSVGEYTPLPATSPIQKPKAPHIGD